MIQQWCSNQVKEVGDDRMRQVGLEDTLILILTTRQQPSEGLRWDSQWRLREAKPRSEAARTNQHLPPPLTRVLYTWSVWSSRLLAVHTKVWPGLFMYFYINGGKLSSGLGISQEQKLTFQRRYWMFWRSSKLQLILYWGEFKKIFFEHSLSNLILKYPSDPLLLNIILCRLFPSPVAIMKDQPFWTTP